MAPLAIRVITKTEIEKKLKSRIIQIIKLINGCELDDDSTRLQIRLQMGLGGFVGPSASP